MKVQQRNLWIVFFVSLAGLLGSLYLSYFGDPVLNLMSGELFHRANGIPACEFCWYIRIVMFPLPIISGVALWKKDFKVWPTILILALVGLGFSFYKYGMQYREFSSVCDWRNPCNKPDVEYFGFINMAFLGIVSFLLMIGLSGQAMYILRKKK